MKQALAPTWQEHCWFKMLPKHKLELGAVPRFKCYLVELSKSLKGALPRGRLHPQTGAASTARQKGKHGQLPFSPKENMPRYGRIKTLLMF